MKNKKITRKVFCAFLLMVFISINTAVMAQNELDQIIQRICAKRQIATNGSFESNTTFRRNNKILVFPAPNPPIDLQKDIAADKDQLKWNADSKSFAEISLRLLPPAVRAPSMFSDFIRACAIKAVDSASITPQHIKDALIALTTCSNDPRCMMPGNLNAMPVTLPDLQSFVNPKNRDSRAQHVPAIALRPGYRPQP